MLFYDESIMANVQDSVLVVGSDIPEVDISRIDILVVPDCDSLSAIEMLMSVYDVGTVYIPDNEELYNACRGYDAFVIRVEGSMSFGIGPASVSVTAGTEDLSLVTRITMGEDRILLCGNMDKQRLEELKSIDTGSFDYINLTAYQKDIAAEILSIYTPHTLIFSGIEPYVEGYEIAKESITLKE